MRLSDFLEKSSCHHSHLCPRQILGVRLGLLGMRALGFDAATDCTVGHRSLRVGDYGKTAAVFVDTVHGSGVARRPALDVRQKAYAYAPNEPRHYFAQMQAYQIMPDDEMFSVALVMLNTPIEAIVSCPGVRVNCDVCGEEIMNEGEIQHEGFTLRRACGGIRIIMCLFASPRHRK